MEVILLKEVQGRGGEGDVVNVSRGFANNYLFTQGFAVPATKSNLKQLEQRRHNIEKREAVRLASAEETVRRLEGTHIAVKAQVGDAGQLFGSVTSSMIADAIGASTGLDIDRRRIELGKPIRTVGEHTVAISVYRNIKAHVVVNVQPQAPEAGQAPRRSAIQRGEAEAELTGEAGADATAEVLAEVDTITDSAAEGESTAEAEGEVREETDMQAEEGQQGESA